jgi:hypothetical protein
MESCVKPDPNDPGFLYYAVELAGPHDRRPEVLRTRQAFLKQERERLRIWRKANPRVWRKLRALTFKALVQFEQSLPRRDRDVVLMLQVSLLKEAAYRPPPIKRYRPAPLASPLVALKPLPLSALPLPSANAPTATAGANAPAPAAANGEVHHNKPQPVDRTFLPKAFGIGGQTKWINHELPDFPGTYGR